MYSKKPGHRISGSLFIYTLWSVAPRGIFRRNSFGRTTACPAKGGRHIGFHCYVVYYLSGTYGDQWPNRDHFPVPVCPVMPNELYTQNRCKSMSWSHVILVSNNILSLEIPCDIARSNFIPILSLMRFTVVLSLQRSGWLLQVYHSLEIVFYNVCRWRRRGSGNGSEEDGCG